MTTQEPSEAATVGQPGLVPAERPSVQPGLVRIEPRRGLHAFGIGELWQNRELVGFLVWRDIKVRYKQTALGAAWAVLQPTMTMIVFSIFFGRLAKMPSDGVPYPIFSYAALLPWNLFAAGFSGAAASLVANTALLRKVYLPRLAIPLGAVLAVFVDFLIAFVVLLAMMAWYRIAPTWHVVLVVPLTALTLIIALGSGVWLSALNVRYRDVKYVLPFLVQIWLFVTPVAYSSSLITRPWLRTVYAVNPMVVVVDGFRYALLGTPAPSVATLLVSTTTSLVVLVVGVIYFRRAERTFADVI